MRDYKKYLLFFKLTIIIITLLVSCKKEDLNNDSIITDGYYSGYFSYSDDTIWEGIVFHADTFIEVASGGVYKQKFPCIVVGLYDINNQKVNFNIYKYPAHVALCDSDIFLSGEYTIEISYERISFWKVVDGLKQTYSLKLINASR
jgi:hypothetical protein